MFVGKIESLHIHLPISKPSFGPISLRIFLYFTLTIIKFKILYIFYISRVLLNIFILLFG
ncbi:uncharacterized protein DS421_16g534070 [Arachis hypogaea]|nr:uncharacterized protein DS421_16g534070 [Arachis hypogaea]